MDDELGGLTGAIAGMVWRMDGLIGLTTIEKGDGPKPTLNNA